MTESAHARGNLIHRVPLRQRRASGATVGSAGCLGPQRSGVPSVRQQAFFRALPSSPAAPCRPFVATRFHRETYRKGEPPAEPWEAIERPSPRVEPLTKSSEPTAQQRSAGGFASTLDPGHPAVHATKT